MRDMQIYIQLCDKQLHRNSDALEINILSPGCPTSCKQAVVMLYYNSTICMMSVGFYFRSPLAAESQLRVQLNLRKTGLSSLARLNAELFILSHFLLGPFI